MRQHLCDRSAHLVITDRIARDPNRLHVRTRSERKQHSLRFFFAQSLVLPVQLRHARVVQAQPRVMRTHRHNDALQRRSRLRRREQPHPCEPNLVAAEVELLEAKHALQQRRHVFTYARPEAAP